MWLQEQLTAFGYETGPIDGYFGYLTEDALLDFQREHRLRPDGIAGPRVFQALLAGLPRRRIVHVAQEGERLSDVAAKHQVSVDLLRWMNRKRRFLRLHAGERLVIRTSSVLAGLKEKPSPITCRELTAHSHLISAVADCTFTLGKEGGLVGGCGADSREFFARQGWKYRIGIVGDGHQHNSRLHNSRLHDRRWMRRLVSAAVERVKEEQADGLFWDVGSLRLGDGGKVHRALTGLRRALPQARLVLSIGPPAAGWRARLSDINYDRLGGLLDQVVLSLHRWEIFLDAQRRALAERTVERMLSTLLRHIPPWKVLLGIPLGACVWEKGAVTPVPFRSALTESYMRRVRPKRDASGLSRFPAADDADEKEYVLQGGRPLDRLLLIAHRYRLGGIFLHPLGYEDRRHWEIVAKRIVAKQTVTSPANLS